ncbi:MAG: hydantoinase/oxoprolinase family protein [Chloroflexota bacterium]
MSYQLGFDIGGTFTDFALLNADSGDLQVFKALTTPQNPAQGALAGIEAFFEQIGLTHQDIHYIIHATTLVANTLIEHKGARVGLLTTQGFRDVLEIRTEQRYDIFDLFLRYPDALSPRYLRRGVHERVDRDGRTLKDVDATEIKAVLRDFKAQGVEAIAVCFLHAFRNPSNEQAVFDIVQAEWPEVAVSLSSVVAPEIREYERTSTTVANAYVQPLLARYLTLLRDELRQSDFEGVFYPMLSSGSTAPLDTALEQPIRMVESGPAAGAIFASHFGHLAGTQDLLAFDMGGTTAKLCLIHDGRPAIAPNLEVARLHRFKKGSGYPLQFPTVDMLEIGAGGGSIAWINTLGLMKIGPESAGANPGPACYGFSGQQPTVTDADLVLGYLNPDYFLGGEMSLDLAAAQQALTQVADPLGMSVIEAADGIHRLVNENMASAAKIHVLEKARDPRNYALMCFGGAGPVHAAGVAKILGAHSVIAPPKAGVASAVGLLIAPTAFDFVRSYPIRLDEADWTELETLFAEMETRGRAMLQEAGISPEQIRIERKVDGRFEGQLHEIEIPLPVDLANLNQTDFIEHFTQQYKRLYHHLPGQVQIELLTWRVTVSGMRKPLKMARLATRSASAEGALKGHRSAYFSEAGGFVETPIYDRYQLQPGMQIVGPAIIEERESTAIIRPAMTANVDEYLNLHIQIGGAA